MQRDRAPRFRCFRPVHGHRVLQAELPSFLQHQDGNRRELLGERSDFEDGLWLGRHIQFDVGQAVAGRLHARAVADDVHSKTRDPVLLHLGFQVIIHLIREGNRWCEHESDERGENENESLHVTNHSDVSAV